MCEFDLPADAPWTVWTVLERATACLEEAGVEDARRNVEWMLEDVLGVRRTQLYAAPARVLSPEAGVTLAGWVRRRCRREPVQYVLGHAAFYGLDFVVTPDVLIPRPETEQVVEEALRRLGAVPSVAPRVLDIGTGSGCIALTLKHERPEARVWGCDVSSGALAVAARNADRLGLPVAFIEADVLAPDFSLRVPAPFDLVVSNPPYVPLDEADLLEPEVRGHEPHLALFSGTDPLRFYRVIAAHARALLAPGGWLVLETHESHAEEVVEEVTAGGLTEVFLAEDLSGRPRIVGGRRG